MDYTVFFRADMNSVIATGHVMRCLSIADAVRSLGGRCIFVSADENPKDLVVGRGYEFISLATNWQQMEDELDVLPRLIKDYDVRVCVIDTYQVTSGYLETLSGIVRTMYIDDLRSFEYPVSEVLCYAINSYDLYADEIKEVTGCGENNDISECDNIASFAKKTLYFSPLYAPIRKEFEKLGAKKISEQINNILVMSGGTDQFGMIDKIVSALHKKYEDYSLTRDIHIRAICGRLNKDIDLLTEKFCQDSAVEIIPSVDDMRSQLEWADVVITAGGSTLYEICAVGTPAITFSFADNQKGNVYGFEKKGLMKYAGDARDDDVAKYICELIDEYENLFKRKEMSGKMQKLVDGMGSHRIARILVGE